MRINLFSVLIDKSTIVFQQRIIPYCNWQFAFIFAKLMAFLSWYASRIEEHPPVDSPNENNLVSAIIALYNIHLNVNFEPDFYLNIFFSFVSVISCIGVRKKLT